MMNRLDPSFIISVDEIELGKPLGEGGFGTVYEGVYSRNKVAVKEVKSADENLELFIQEITIMSKLHSPNIVELYGVTLSQRYLIVMQLMPAGSLFQLLHNTPVDKLSWKDRLSIARDIASGIEYLHKNRIFHRDLKSDNVLLDKTATGVRAKLTDFGLASFASDDHGVVGTLPWMAPELFSQQQTALRYDLADIYAYGMTLWELVTHKIPHQGLKRFQIRIRVCDEKQRETIPAETPWRISKLITDCWRSVPLSRPSVGEIIDTVDQCLKLVHKIEILNGLSDKRQYLLDRLVRIELKCLQRERKILLSLREELPTLKKPVDFATHTKEREVILNDIDTELSVYDRFIDYLTHSAKEVLCSALPILLPDSSGSTSRNWQRLHQRMETLKGILQSDALIDQECQRIIKANNAKLFNDPKPHLRNKPARWDIDFLFIDHKPHLVVVTRPYHCGDGVYLKRPAFGHYRVIGGYVVDRSAMQRVIDWSQKNYESSIREVAERRKDEGYYVLENKDYLRMIRDVNFPLRSSGEAASNKRFQVDPKLAHLIDLPGSQPSTSSSGGSSSNNNEQGSVSRTLSQPEPAATTARTNHYSSTVSRQPVTSSSDASMHSLQRWSTSFRSQSWCADGEQSRRFFISSQRHSVGTSRQASASNPSFWNNLQSAEQADQSSDAKPAGRPNSAQP